MQLCQVLCRGTGENSQQARNQTRSNDAINDLAAISLVIHIGDAIQDKLIGGVTHNLTNAAHQLGNKRPGERRYQGAEEAAALSQAGGGNAGNEAMLFHDAQNVLTRGWVHIWLLIEYARDCCGRNARYARNIPNRQLSGHSNPSSILKISCNSL